MQRQFLRYHPSIGYTFVPALKTRVVHEGSGYLMRTNASGFRCDHDFVTTGHPDSHRALLFGDSYTAGDGVSNGMRYGDLLEGMVPGLQVYNFGLPGTGTGLSTRGILSVTAQISIRSSGPSRGSTWRV